MAHPLFSPPLYRQRNQFVVDYVFDNKPKKVVDLGCGECSLLRRLKFHRDIELLVGVDLDRAKAMENKHSLAPLATDYLQPSFRQLCVQLYQGSVTQRDSRLRGFDLVTSMELIEHLPLHDVERFSDVLFGFMAPLAVIVSTPNSEFNPHLPGLSGFRHWDHKFEWTRAEFQSWARKVCSQYGFVVEFTGVGHAPPGLQESVGFCTQIGVFHRVRGEVGVNSESDEQLLSHTLLCSMTYPSLSNNNLLQQVLVGEVLYGAEMVRRGWMEESQGTEEHPSGGSGSTENGLTEERAETLWIPMEDVESMSSPVELHVRCMSLDGESEEDPTLPRCVSVPLHVLWSCCPRVRQLSGSIMALRHLITGDPRVRLSQDGWAVILQRRDREEEEDDSGFAETSQASASAVEDNWGEDWEAEV